MKITAAVLAALAVAAAVFMTRSSTDGESETNYFEIIVPQGRMVLRLFDETPLHRDNFQKLAAEEFYDGTTFHRVIEGFMIQGGDPNSRDGDPNTDGLGGPGYTIPAEIVPGLHHVRGAVAAARIGDQANPERESSGSQFYIVHGMVFDDAMLNVVERQIAAATGNSEYSFPDEVRASYRELGGTPNLDLQYTVFGRIVEGLDVLDAVAGVETPRKAGQAAPPPMIDRPYEDVTMTVRPLPDYREE